MNYAVLSAMVNGITSLSVAVLVFARNRKDPIHRCFFVFAFSVSLWAFGCVLWQLSTARESALFWIRFATVASIIIPVVFFEFILRLLDLTAFPAWLRRVNYGVAGLIAAVSYSPWFIQDIKPVLDFPFWPVPGIAFYFFRVFFVVNILVAYVLMAARWKCVPPPNREKILFVFVATAIGLLGGMANHFLWFGAKFFPIGNVGVTVSILILACAVAVHCLLDIEFFIKKSLVFAGLFVGMMGVVAIVTAVTQGLLGRYFQIPSLVSRSISVLIAILLYDPVRRWLVHLTEDVLFQQEVDYEAIDHEIADQIQITDLARQVKNIVGNFESEFALENAAIFIFDEGKKEFRLAHGIGYDADLEGSALPGHHPLVAFLSEHSEGVLLTSLFSENAPAVVRDFFAFWKAEVCCKIPFKGAVIGILLLGKKKSDRDFTQKDMDFLDRVVKNLGVSINNAKSFKFKEDYYALMAEKNKTDVLARLSEGIDHEIKNPLNAIKPAAQRIQSILGKGPAMQDPEAQAKVREYLEMIIRNTDRINGIMTRLRNFARPVRTSDGFKLVPIRLRDLVEEAIGLGNARQFETDGIVIENNVPEEIYIFGDHASVVQVFWNLIVNAYHAIDQTGRITIAARFSEADGKVLAEVTDTGKGIASENMDKIFTPFFTTKPTNVAPDGGMRFTGTGLGLCYVKQYVENLGGHIRCASQLNEGTSFYLKFLRADAPRT
ncbi:MAG: ATP-binding protein [Candidatus Omnitrophica bacterium]|nr:ATP-binding protein [Candidatus Omnitrophota bacterium]MDD5671714.1 ATP-binding protein [Candidatus Omnitrophota bacterium]